MDRTEDKEPKYSWGTGIPCSKDARESAAGGLTDLLPMCFHHRGGGQTGSLKVSGPQARARDRTPTSAQLKEWVEG